MQKLLDDLYAVKGRSITGPALRTSLSYFAEAIGVPLDDFITEIPSGTKAFDWTVPKEWKFRRVSLYKGVGKCEKIFDTNHGDTDLHCIGYSRPFDGELTAKEVREMAVPGPIDLPDAVPYVTSYYKKRTGITLSRNQYNRITHGRYRLRIDTDTYDGSLTYGEVVILGQEREEIFLSSYMCHPQMVNNELSGPVVLAEIIKWWKSEPRRYTLRALVVPETIGMLAYLQNLGSGLELRVHDTTAAYVLSCMGGIGLFDVFSGPWENYAVRIACAILGNRKPIAWKHRLSNERQLGAPGIDFPVAAIMRTIPRGGRFPEYHTSADNLDLVTVEQLDQSFITMKRILESIERDRYCYSETLGEPFLTGRKLHTGTLSKVGSSDGVRDLLDVWGYCDGRSSLEIAEELSRPLASVQILLETLRESGIVKLKEN